jgi:hypothetical protein
MQLVQKGAQACPRLTCYALEDSLLDTGEMGGEAASGQTHEQGGCDAETIVAERGFVVVLVIRRVDVRRM